MHLIKCRMKFLQNIILLLFILFITFDTDSKNSFSKYYVSLFDNFPETKFCTLFLLENFSHFLFLNIWVKQLPDCENGRKFGAIENWENKWVLFSNKKIIQKMNIDFGIFFCTKHYCMRHVLEHIYYMPLYI